MTPEARRAQIVEAARQLMTGPDAFAVSTADVAEAAGVTRALVHHYFRGIGELRQAVALDIVSAAPSQLHSGTDTPVAERVRRNVATSLDLLWANRNVWLANLAAGEVDEHGEPPLRRQLREGTIEQMLANHADLITDTPWTRLCLGGYFGFSEAACRQWILGDADRPSVESALVETLLHLLLVTIPSR